MRRIAMSDRSDRPQDQSGFALLAVLAAIAMTAVVIGALFGLLSVTMRVSEQQARTAREMRSADGAIETAINRMRTQPCASPAVPYLSGVAFDQQTAATNDDVSVDVRCNTSTSVESSTDQVRLVGRDGYQGDVAWKVDCAVTPGAPGCFPWTASLGSLPAAVATSDAALVHSGPLPLRFTTGVRVRTGSVALRSASTDTPAIDVGGSYLQGSAGLLATGANRCGVLDPAGARPSGVIRDADGVPECEVVEARLVDGEPTEAQSGLIPSSAAFTIPNCSSAVVRFTRGTYTVAQTAAVSALLDGSNASCRNKTFWFQPGVYAFKGAALTFGDAGSYYVFGSPTTWNATAGVQGDALAAGRPDAALCDTRASGTSIVISSQTEIRHRAGRVAICPVITAGSGEPDTAIYQETSKPTAITVTTPMPLSRAFNCRLPYFNFSGQTYPDYWDIDQYGQCRPIRSYNVATATEGIAPLTSLRVMITGNEDLTTPNNLITERTTQIRVRRANGSEICRTDWVPGVPNGRLASTFDVLRSGGTCAVASNLTNQSQLNGGTITIAHRMLFANYFVTQRLDISKVELEVNPATATPATATTAGQWLNVGAAANPDAAAASPVMPAGCTTYACPIADPGRQISPDDRSDRFVHQMRLDDFTFTGLPNFASGLDPNVMTLRALVKVATSTVSMPAGLAGLGLQPGNFIPEGYTYLELRSPQGSRCITQGSGMNSDQEIAFDLLSVDLLDQSPAGCTDFLFDNASQLDEVSVTLRFEMPCVRNWWANVPWECFRTVLYNPGGTEPVWQVRPPDVSGVRLTMVTDSYSGAPPTSDVTVEATDGARASTFNVFGKVWMPLSDVDIHWKGEATEAPLFGDDLVLHGLGSRMTAPPPGRTLEMGVVCCAPPEVRTVDIIAVVGGVDRLHATVEFTDVVADGAGNRVRSPGHRVRVLDWERCDTGCASVRGVSQVNGGG